MQYAKETTAGTTPSPFARQTLAITGTSLNATPNRSDSATIIDNRLKQKSPITSVEYGGDVSTELRFGAVDEFISGAAMNEWVAGTEDDDPDVLTFGGDVKKTFSILIGYTDLTGTGSYQLFKGEQVASWTLSIPEEGIITSNFTFMGLDRQPLSTAPAGTVTPANLETAISTVGVGEILIDGVSTLNVACLASFDFTWSNELIQIPCLGSGLKGGKVKETNATGTGSFTMAWSDKAITLFESQFNEDATISLVVPITDVEGNSYKLTLPKIQITTSLPDGGMGEWLNGEISYEVVESAPTLERLAA